MIESFLDKIKVLEDIAININDDDVLRTQGYTAGKKSVRKEIMDTYYEEKKQAIALIKPVAVTTIKTVSIINNGKLLVGGKYILTTGGDYSILSRATHLLMVVCTIGQGVENRVKDLFNHVNYTAASLLDAMGSIAVEECAKNILHYFSDTISKDNFRIITRLSPGQGEWDISEQQVIFNILCPESIGVRLTDGFMMIPQKSSSFVTGIGVNPLEVNGLSLCSQCTLTDCLYRK